MSARYIFTQEQDIEDYEQELEIQKWLASTGNQGGIELKHINSKGRPSNTLVTASFSLDETLREDSTGTFADIIAGHSDGSSCLGDAYGEDREAPSRTLDVHLMLMGFSKKERLWLIKMLKLSGKMNNRTHSPKYLTDLVSWEPSIDCER